ncbi:MAG: cytochrome c biogenesis protein CcsA [Alphaproteobacteria bacterium]|jgi:ABC-type uncharacterized transport system permease subunit|nr:cytochrome c biogenesis protein CcsA [Rhodospirillaceae bacterium]MBT6204495.1 cytochrome c biogenesis protein CcsA [Rhodospirillaceae bacterium]MBT6512779.1 cytochrome c biogenesis protein CcsA [Rhodospirillaceae bacterium]MBT7647515.1 cytochrome c biogenesis protein CcsA [Rhodospirillaceae bacterium]MDG2479817.1 cytochrome c biogenesis protein CcsA [Alphaproteobacteria bacterium]
MASQIWPHLVVLALLFPAVVVGLLSDAQRSGPFWSAFGIAALASTAWTAAQLGPSWSTGFAAALWLTVAASFVIFLILCLVMTEIPRLGGLLAPYLAFLSVIAVIWSQAPAQPTSDGIALGWFGVHIALSVVTYVFLTLAAVSGAAVVLQERALKRRAPSRLTRLLPSLADSEQLEYRLLGAGEIVLAAGIATGMGAQYAADGGLLDFGHKTILTLAAFVVIGALLLARILWGTRGRLAARYVLIGYLLVTLAYPGVKFVTDVLMG